MNLLGKKLKWKNKNFRIVEINEEYMTLCDMDASNLELFLWEHNNVLLKIETGEYLVEEEPTVIVDETKFNKKQLNSYRNIKKAVMKIIKLYSGNLMELTKNTSKPEIQKIIKEANLYRTTVYKYLRRYIVSGFSEVSLVDRRLLRKQKDESRRYMTKPGTKPKDGIQQGIPLSPEVREHFEKAIEYYKSGKHKTIRSAYDWMNIKYYSTYDDTTKQKDRLPISKRPTYNQFYYYLHKRIGQNELNIIKKGRMEARNSSRLLYQSSRKNGRYPGQIVECDACETDVSLVDGEQIYTLGRAIVYFMVDVYSSAIIAASVSFENNSMIGLTNLFLNLVDDKEERCKTYGISMNNPDDWPSNILPEEIRCDRGADFVSDSFGEICNKLDITRTVEPAGQGSYKGIVEQSFHQFRQSFMPSLEEKGLITKDHDSNHHETAMLTIDDFTAMVFAFVLFHNKTPIKEYPMTKKMIAENIEPSPVSLWAYGSRNGGARKITDAMKGEIIYNLLVPKKASLSKKGIQLDGLLYLPGDEDMEERMYKLGNRRESINIKIDPRSVDEVYYLKDNKVMVSKLNEQRDDTKSFKGLTWNEYQKWHEERNRIKREGERKKECISIEQTQINDLIVSASQNKILPSSKNMTENRQKAKERTNYDNRVITHLGKEKELIEQKDEPEIIENENNVERLGEGETMKEIQEYFYE